MEVVLIFDIHQVKFVVWSDKSTYWTKTLMKVEITSNKYLDKSAAVSCFVSQEVNRVSK